MMDNNRSLIVKKKDCTSVESILQMTCMTIQSNVVADTLKTPKREVFNAL